MFGYSACENYIKISHDKDPAKADFCSEERQTHRPIALSSEKTAVMR